MSRLIATLLPIPGAALRELRALTLRGPRAREPLQAVLSVLLAVSVATLLRLDDLDWAALSGYMVMRSDMAQSLPRGLMRIAGTIGGASIGMLLAPAVADAPLLLAVCLFILSWIATFQSLTSRHSYAWLLFGVTAGLIMTEALAEPSAIVHFAGTRVAEIIVGTCSCLIVASLFAVVRPSAGAEAPQPAAASGPRDSVRSWLSEERLQEHWPAIRHSTRAALAVALLPLAWRFFEIEDFSQSAITSFVIMIIPLAAVHDHGQHTIYERMAHRTLGCLLGSVLAIACLSVVGDDLPAVLLTLSAGIWVGYHVQIGREGIAYVGTQFTLGFLVTFVQGPGPVTSILPGLDRLLGIVIGCATLCLVMVLWPSPEKE